LDKDRPSAAAEAIELARGITRPALTFIGLVAWICFFAKGYDIPPEFTALAFGNVV